jgi:hypothetical protein
MSVPYVCRLPSQPFELALIQQRLARIRVLESLEGLGQKNVVLLTVTPVRVCVLSRAHHRALSHCRALLEYLDRKTREIQEQNKCAQWAMCCVKCCMWCLEQIVKFINRNAYIIIAIKGQGYCCAAIHAVKLIITVRTPRASGAAGHMGQSTRHAQRWRLGARLGRRPHVPQRFV